jgi:hypothetical protein
MKSFETWLQEKKMASMPQATTVVSAPLRGAAQDQSGIGTKGSAADYTISDDTNQQTNLGGGKGPIGGKYGMPTGTTNQVTQAMKARNDKMSVKKSMREDLATSSLISIGAAIMGVLEAKNLSPKQKKIAALAGDRDKIDAADFKALRSKKMEEEVKSLEEGRPKKNSTAEDPGGEHPIAQLRKIVSMRGQVPFKHVNPKQKSNIDVKTAHSLLSKHDNMKTSAEKLEFASRIHKSPEEMQSVIRGEPAKNVPRVSLAGKITGTQSE